MKPPVVHQSVEPPRSGEDNAFGNVEGSVEPASSAGADDGRDVRYDSTFGPSPGLVGDFGPIVGTTDPASDGAADDKRKSE